ncbi:MAG: hypothetical protein LBK27_02460 [Treponema sp.]|jgi:hypothetical protein|nr:hypothetical protein [Treponema sp.]
MIADTYIGKVKSEKFNYDISCPEKFNTGYSPEPIVYIPGDTRRIFMDIVRDAGDKKENTKQTDWGCFIIKMNKENLVKYLSKYNPDIPELENNEIYIKIREKHKNFLIEIEKLDAEKEYLLVAKETM